MKMRSSLKKVGVITCAVSVISLTISLFCIFAVDQLEILTAIFWIIFGVSLTISLGVSVIRGVMEIKSKMNE